MNNDRTGERRELQEQDIWLLVVIRALLLKSRIKAPEDA
jgi:hypothetical protein